MRHTQFFWGIPCICPDIPRGLGPTCSSGDTPHYARLESAVNILFCGLCIFFVDGLDKTDYGRGMNLKEYMQKERMRQGPLAERLGFSQSFVSRLMNGRNLPTIRVAEKIEIATNGAVRAQDWYESAQK